MKTRMLSRRSLAFLCLGLTAPAICQTPAFEVASVRPSPAISGRDGDVIITPGRFAARQATLKRLIFEAWELPFAQIAGGPGWLDRDEFDVEAKAAGPVDAPHLRLMLRALLMERFQLQLRIEKKEGRIYTLLVGKNGSKLPQPPQAAAAGTWKFHGSLAQFSNILGVQLTIPLLEDPATPSRARGNPIPVVDMTGLEGDFDFAVQLRPDPGADPFTVWQRALEEQLGLKLESRKSPIQILTVDHAARVPTGN